MKTRSRSLSFLTALILVLSLFALLPRGAFTADAYSGAGTKDDPYIIGSYYDLFNILEADAPETYIKLGANIASIDNKNYYDLGTYSDNMTCVYHVDLAGHTVTRRANTIDRAVFEAGKNTTLIIDDSVGGGTVVDEISVTTAATDYSCLFSARGGKLIVNGGFYSQTDAHKEIFSSVSSPIEIYGGTFTTNYNFFNLRTTKPCITVYGGTFLSYATDVSYGLIFKYSSPDFKIYNMKIKGMNTPFRIQNKYSPYPPVGERFSKDTKVVVDGDEKTREKLENSSYLSGKDIVISTPTTGSATISAPDLAHGSKAQNAKVSAGLGFIMAEDCPTSWYDLTDEKDIKIGDTFIGGHKYRMGVVIGAEDGYIIGKEPTVFTYINNAKVTSVEKLSEYFCTVMIEIECPKIAVSNVNVNLTEPRAGEAINETMTSATAGVIVSSGRSTATTRDKGSWYHNGTKMSAGDKFEAGETYTAQFTVRTSTGYTFSESPTVTANGRAASLKNGTNSSRTYLISYTLTNEITKAELSGTAPAAGNKPAAVTVKSGNVKVTAVWYRGTTRMAEGETFTARQKYTVSCMVLRKDTTEEFSENVKVTFNGLSMKVTKVYPAYVLCQATFTAAAASGLKGDVNNDGSVDMLDLTTLQRSINGWDVTINEANADLSGDGDINMLDLTALQRLINSMNAG